VSYFGTYFNKIVVCRKIRTLASRAEFSLYRPRPASPQINGTRCLCARQEGV